MEEHGVIYQRCTSTKRAHNLQPWLCYSRVAEIKKIERDTAETAQITSSGRPDKTERKKQFRRGTLHKGRGKHRARFWATESSNDLPQVWMEGSMVAENAAAMSCYYWRTSNLLYRLTCLHSRPALTVQRPTYFARGR